MSERNDTLAYALGHVNAAYIAEAEIPALTAAAACPGRWRKESHPLRFWESNWFAAAVSAVVAVTVLGFIVLAGQKNPTSTPAGTDDIRPPVTETGNTEVITEEPASPHTVPEGFAVTDAMYPYEGEQIILLRVRNGTAENTTISIRMVYQDESGHTVARAGQTITGLSAGHEQYVLFRTAEEISSYTYEIKAKRYDGPYLQHLYRSEYSHIEETSLPIFPGEHGYNPEEFEADGTDYPCLAVHMTGTYTGTVPVDVTRTYVLFDNQGRIYHIQTMGIKYMEAGYGEFLSTAMCLHYTTADTVQWPTELKGEGVTCIEIYSVGPPNPSVSIP